MAWWAALALSLLLIGVLRGVIGRAPLRGKLVAMLRARVPGLEVSGTPTIDWRGRVSVGPLRWRGEGGKPLLTIDRLIVRPSYHALLGGRLEAASLHFGQVAIDAGVEGGRLVALVRDLRAGLTHASASTGRATGHAPVPFVQIDGLRIDGALAGGAKVSVGFRAVKVRVRRDAGLSLEASGSVVGGGVLQLKLTRLEGAPLSLVATMDQVRAGALPPGLRARLPFRIDAGVLSAKLETIGAGLRRGTLRLWAKASGLALEAPRLSDAPLGPLTIGFTGNLRWDAPGRRFTLERGALSLGKEGKPTLALAADLRLAGVPSLSASAKVTQLAFPQALRALPPSLRPPAEAPQVQGNLSGSVSLSGPLRTPEAWKVDATLDLSGLKPLNDARTLDLGAPFRYRAVDANGQTHTLWIGPNSPDYVPLADLPEYVWRAVTTSEDAGFFAHHGFDFDELKNSLIADALAGRAVRGGSTLTQQLAKNLYLSKEKTFARKVREALATVGLEVGYSKKRLLELYLNLIQWGPGIYGIGPAARHYFGKDARALTPKEAAFLATIIPNPVRFSIYYERGALTDNWEKRVDDLLGTMHDDGYLTDEQHLDALTLPLVFARPDPAQAPAATPSSR